VDLVKGLACRDSCEQEVRGLIQMIESSMRIYPVGTKVWLAHRSNVLWTAAACVILGMLFGTWGALNDPPIRVVTAMGAILVLWGIIQAIQAFRLRAPTEGAGRAPE
jgi:hypothetical protein